MVAALTLAITGGTGFVGARLLGAALSRGHQVRALTRRPVDTNLPPSLSPEGPGEGLLWVVGSLEDASSLASLVEGADAVIHVAGVVNAPDAAGFESGNVTGTGGMLGAAEKAGIARFVHVSSLAAREPGLSLYGGSKARSEALVTASPLAATIVRPPAIYGPGDRELLEMFRMATRGLVLVPPPGRLSLLHVDDLAALLLALADPAAPSGLILEPDDGHSGGCSQVDFGNLLGAAVGRKVRTLSMPRLAMAAAARADRLLRGAGAKLTPDRAAYFCHPDWVSDPAKSVPAHFWQPQIPTPQGLADTAAWYRSNGWL